jgi:hypothetical protein
MNMFKVNILRNVSLELVLYSQECMKSEIVSHFTFISWSI